VPNDILRRLSLSAFALALANCGGAATNTPEAPAKPRVTKAEDVTAAFAKAGLKVTDVTVVTDKTDDNQLLGRPGQYTSKVFFYDARHPKSAAEGQGENTVEVFGTDADAKARHDYIDQVTKGVPMLLQYQLRQGRALVRFDKEALPSEVDEYRKVLAGLDTN